MLVLETAEGRKTYPRSHPALSSLTHGYAITSHAAQGQTAQDVIAVIDSKERMLTSQVAFYVSVSRTADTLALIVDDREKVTSALQRHTGLNVSALDTAGRLTDLTGLDKDPVAGGQDKGAEKEAVRDTSNAVEEAASTPAMEQEPDLALDREISI